jgi:hypothetical protein
LSLTLSTARCFDWPLVDRFDNGGAHVQGAVFDNIHAHVCDHVDVRVDVALAQKCIAAETPTCSGEPRFNGPPRPAD